MHDDEPYPPDSPARPRTVEISDMQAHLAVDRQALAAVVAQVLALEGRDGYNVSLALVDDPAIHAINRRHLEHDWPTDVITFPLSEPDEPILAGELIVSAEMAAATAREAGVDPWAELVLYVVHGLLHLCGRDDRNEEDAGAMRRREAEILAQLGLPNTFPLAGLVLSQTGFPDGGQSHFAPKTAQNRDSSRPFCDSPRVVAGPAGRESVR